LLRTRLTIRHDMDIYSYYEGEGYLKRGASPLLDSSNE